MVRAPSLVEGSEDVSLYDSVTVVAEFPEQLVIVVGAVGKAGPLVVPVAEEGLLTLGAGEVLDVPVLAQGGDHPLLYRPPAGPAEGDVHLVVTPETVQEVDLVGGQPGPGPDLPGRAGQLRPTARAGEVVWAVGLSLAE